MPAGSASLNFQQQINFKSLSAPALGTPAQIAVQFLSNALSAVSLAAGSGAGQYNTMYAGTFSSGSPTVLNLTNTLTMPDGTLATFADVILIAVYAAAANTDYISMGAGTDAVAWLSTAIKLYPGQYFVTALPVATGLAVTTTTADRITFTPNSGTQAGTVMLAGH